MSTKSKPGRALLAALASAALAAALASCSTGDATSNTAGYVEAGAGEITIVPPEKRKDAPVLEGRDLYGKPLSTKPWKGQTIVINVWGPWCPPCRKEMPALQKVWEEYADRDVKFVGVLNRSKSDTAIAFNEKIGVTYPSFADQGGKLELKFNDSLPTVAVPTTWIIDPNGKVAVRIAVGDLTAKTLAGLVDDVQAEAK